MKILSVIPEQIKTAARTLFNGAPTGTGDIKGVKPSGTNGLVILCLVTMANAADLLLSVVTADDADGATPVAIAENIPVFLDDVRQADAKTHNIPDASGSFVVVFAIPPLLIPADKFICLQFANSNAANILSAQVLDDVYHETGKAA